MNILGSHYAPKKAKVCVGVLFSALINSSCASSSQILAANGQSGEKCQEQEISNLEGSDLYGHTPTVCKNKRVTDASYIYDLMRLFSLERKMK